MIPPRLVLEVGGTSALQAAVPGELKSPPTWNLEVGGTSTLQAQLPARLKSPPLQAQVWGGSRWADLAVHLDNIDRHKLYVGMQYTELRENYFGITPLG